MNPVLGKDSCFAAGGLPGPGESHNDGPIDGIYLTHLAAPKAQPGYPLRRPGDKHQGTSGISDECSKACEEGKNPPARFEKELKIQKRSG